LDRTAITPDQFSTLGELLKFLRRRAGLTQRELSMAVGYSDAQISRIEKGERIPDAATLQALFVPALDLDRDPGWVSRLLELAAGARHPDSSGSAQSTPPNNLPVSLTAFIGRDKEQQELGEFLDANRLVTLLGPGGIGKTRLSLKVGEREMGNFPDGVWLVELAPLGDSEVLLQTLAAVLDISTQAPVPTGSVLVNFLRTRKILLILDNCEHLLDACAQTADMLLKACPHLKILSTSRQALGIPGEIQYRVPPLGLPGLRESLPRLQGYEAARLFVERARLARPDFNLNAGNAPAIARICSSLDGIPLAIELAAARLNVFSPQEIAVRLEGSISLLTGGSRTAQPHQQTLRASIDWSWGLLSEGERSLMRRLAVFVGGWTLEAAEAVCSAEDIPSMDLLESLGQLVAKSIVIVDRSGDATRYAFHETLRQYAREKLVGSGEIQKIVSRHLHYFLKLSEEAEPALHGPQQVEWFDRLKLERDNFRAALEFALSADPEAGLYLSARLFGYWIYFDMREGLRWLTALLESPESTSYPLARAAALQAQGSIYWHSQQFEVAGAIFEECIALSRRFGDRRAEIDALLAMAGVMQFVKGMKESNEYRMYALDLAESIGDLWRQAVVHEVLGWDQRHPGQSRAHWQQAILLFRQLGDWRNLERTLAIHGFTALSGGDMAAGQILLDEALEVNQRTRDRRSMEFILTGKSLLALRHGEFKQARALLQENIDILEEIGNRMGWLWARARLGYVAFRSGNSLEAHQILSEVIEAFQLVRNRSGLAYALDKMAGLFISEEKFESAARLIGWSDAARDEVGDPRPEIEQEDVDRDIVRLKKKLGRSGFSQAYHTGRSMSLEAVAASALTG